MSADPRYAAEIERLAKAIRTWVQEHPGTCLQLNPPNFDAIAPDPVQREMLRQRYAALAPGKRMGIIAGLADVIDWWAGNEETKELLRHLDKISGYQATYQMVDIAMIVAFNGAGNGITPNGISN